MKKFKCLSRNTFSNGDFKLIPIRFKDRYEIMKWRNEQIYHLRQNEPLTKEVQDDYFAQVVDKLFYQEQPNQILFSFLSKDECVGYGGLVHINWQDKNAEVSFVMNTSLENNSFTEFWSGYLAMIEKVAFNVLMFKKLYVYAFDLRPNLYSTLELNSYFLDARLKEHCFFKGEFKDVVIYSKIYK